MDGGTIGLIGGIFGGVVGVAGGLAGTFVSIRATKGVNERAFMIRASTLCWLGIVGFLAALLASPMPWRAALWLVYGPALFGFIRWGNRRAAEARAADEGLTG